MFGFAFGETMRGTYFLLDTPADDRALEFTIRVEGNGLRRFAKKPVARITGEVTVEGKATRAPLDGTLAFKIDEKRLIYDFTFRGDAGEGYRFRGQKDLFWLAPLASISTLPSTLYDADGNEIGRAVVRFDLRADTTKLVRSLRLRLAS